MSRLLVPAGWTVVLKSNGDETMQYSAPYWTDTTTVLNDDQDMLEIGNAKYSAYNTQVSETPVSLSTPLP